MTPPDNQQTDNKSGDAKNDKTVKLQRCPKHGALYLPSEGCPECAKEKGAAAG